MKPCVALVVFLPEKSSPDSRANTCSQRSRESSFEKESFETRGGFTRDVRVYTVGLWVTLWPRRIIRPVERSANEY